MLTTTKRLALVLVVLVCAAPAWAQQPVQLVGTPTVDFLGTLIGTAGTPASRVLSIQGVASGTAVPVSGTVTVNAGTNLNTSALALDATLTGGTQQTKITDGTNVATVKAASTAAVAADKAVVVAVSPNNTVPVSGTVTANAGTNLNTSALALDATLTGGTQQTKITDGTNVATVKAASTAAVAADKAVVVAVSPNNTIPISAASLPLPSTAATSTKQSDGTQKTQIVDGSGNVIASTSNNLNVQCANCSGSGVSTADEATMTPGTSLFVGTGGFFQTTATSNALTTGQQGMFQVTAQRALFSNLRNASGTEVGTSGAPLRMDPTGTTTQPVSGTVTANAGTNLNTSALALDATLTGGTAQTKITDGTNVATVKAASTAAVAADKAVVVAISPNNTIPVSGTVTANAGTNLNTSALALDATLTGGTAQSKITDGTNVATVKAASTAAVAADKALVVAVSPNLTVTVAPPVATPVLANALTTTVVTVIGSAKTLDSYFCWNPNSTVEYVQIFDISGAVTLGTSTPKWSIGIPPTSAGNLSNINLTFANAIKVAATTTATGSTAPTTALDCNFGYR